MTTAHHSADAGKMVQDHPMVNLFSYVNGVLEGTIPANALQVAAVERHVRDLETGHRRGLRFDEVKAAAFCRFFGLLRHWKGDAANKPFVLEPWQVFIVASLFGWLRADGTRRFRSCFIMLPRKNGKSAMASGIGLAMLTIDGEEGAEVYSAATTQTQARIVFDSAWKMVGASPHLRKRLKRTQAAIFSHATHSTFKPVSSEASSIEGTGPSCALVDELHVHRDRSVWDVLRTGSGARRQPLLLGITTAGDAEHRLDAEFERYAARVLDPAAGFEDDAHFAFVAKADEGDDWRDEATWRKANPNLGVSVSLGFLRDECTKAKASRADEIGFRRYYLNERVEDATSFIELAPWDASAGLDDGETPDAWRARMLEACRGRRCFAGLDLSQTTDITAMVLWFPPEGEEPGVCLPWFWIPGDTAMQAQARDRVPYLEWRDRGFVDFTHGDTIDHEYILKRIGECRTAYQMRKVAYDRWGAAAVQTKLQAEGDDIVPFAQSFAGFNPAIRAMEAMYRRGMLAHGGNPVLRWMATNAVVQVNSDEHVRFHKARSMDKIDGMVALAMAIGVSMLPDEGGPSVYEGEFFL